MDYVPYLILVHDCFFSRVCYNDDIQVKIRGYQHTQKLYSTGVSIINTHYLLFQPDGVPSVVNQLVNCVQLLDLIHIVPNRPSTQVGMLALNVVIHFFPLLLSYIYAIM